MKIDKKKVFRIHSWIGIKLSVLFFIVCFSGTLATLSHEMDWLFIPSIRAVPQAEMASRNQMVANIRAQYPAGEIIYWQAPEEPYLCHIIHLQTDGHRQYLFANPYTGEVQGLVNLTFQRFFRDLHYYLFIPFQLGHFTVLIFGFLLLISLVTALYFYKKWWRKLFELTTGKGSLVFFRSLHRLVGVWSAPFTLLFSLTGIWYFIERANVAGVSDTANLRTPSLEVPFVDSSSFQVAKWAINYDEAIMIARRQISGLQVKDILPPSSPVDALYLTGKSQEALVRNRANRVYLHPKTLKVLWVQRADALPAATWLNDIADPLHFGYWGGLATKVIWFVLGLGISSLVLSGIWIAQKRKVKGRAKQKAQKMGYWKYANWAVYILMFGFMYYTLVTRYQASTSALLLITVGWAFFLAVSWYLFEYSMKRIVRKGLVR